jgi:hypothetical protein
MLSVMGTDNSDDGDDADTFALCAALTLGLRRRPGALAESFETRVARNEQHAIAVAQPC